MGIRQLKKLNEKMPGWIKMMAAPLIRQKLIRNNVFQQQYQALDLFESKTADQQEIIQLELLRNSLQYAYCNSQYYHDLFDRVGFNPDELTDKKQIGIIPAMNKDIVRNHFTDIMAEGCTDFYMATTGGSTGNPLKIELDRNSIYKEKAFIYHFWSKYGYDYHKSKIATFRGLEFKKRYSMVNPLYNEIQLNPFLLNEETIKHYIKIIDRFGAEFLHGYPSVIYHFCCCLEQKGLCLKKKIKAVFFISENIYSFQREKIEQVLKCRTAAFYGHSERAVFAEQIGRDTYMFNSLYGYAEITSEGKLLCTGFINQRMPLVRYDTEDSAVILEDGVYQIHGHHSKDVLIGKNGEQISGAAINFHTDVTESIVCYQFIQEEPGKAKMLVVINDNRKADLLLVQKMVQNKLGNVIDIMVEPIEKPLLSNRGKYQMIIQKLNNQ